MAKSTFFIRGRNIADHTTQTRVSSEIDLGAYVNLGTTKPQVLRIHGIQIQICDVDGLPPAVDAAPTSPVGQPTNAFLACAITTKETALAVDAMPDAYDDSTIFTASYVSSNFKHSDDQGVISQYLDSTPQYLTNGQLIGVDTLYLYALPDNAWAENVHVNYVLECSVEPATRENAINLALSQA